MGAGSSIEVPGGGTEGYHVLRVSENVHEFDVSYSQWECIVCWINMFPF